MFSLCFQFHGKIHAKFTLYYKKTIDEPKICDRLILVR
jgi:hypothetical protein